MDVSRNAPDWAAPGRTRPRRVAWVAVAVLGVLGLVAAVLQAPSEHTEAARTVQSLVSVALPFLGAGLGWAATHPAGDLYAGGPVRALLPAVSVAAGVGMLAGVATILVGLVAGFPPGSGWPTVLLAGVAVQVLAQLVGTGFGFLAPRAWLAGIATVVVPLGCYQLALALGSSAWLTPYAGVQAIIAPTVAASAWLRWLAVLAVWGVGLNLVGLAAAARRRRRTS